jgi:hypothetical protein
MSELISLDSCKIRIPLEQCQIINKSLYAHWIEVNEDTGELRDDSQGFRSKAYRHNFEGITTRCAIEVQMTADKTNKEYLTFGINSKMLKERYFEGVTTENKHLVYEYLIGLELASFSLEDFISTECTDVDFKSDFVCDSLDLLINKMKSLSQPTQVADRGYKAFNSSTNMGIQWSNRKTTALNKPFVKIYSKELDLLHHSTEFYEAHIRGQAIKDKTRVEFTIKNRKHFRTHGIQETTLEAILSIPQALLSKMLQVSVSKHIMKSVRRKKEGAMSAKEQKVFNAIKLLQMHNIGINEGKFYLYSELHPKTKKRDEDYFDEIWWKHFSKLDKSEQLNDVEKWLEIVGVRFI